jgi:hypothetical protein
MELMGLVKSTQLIDRVASTQVNYRGYQCIV